MSDFDASPPKEKRTRRPVQERSLERMTRVIEAAERMLEQLGPEKTSIPALAALAEVPRASIYPFFPDKYALFAHISQIHMRRLADAIADSDAARARTLSAWVRRVIDICVEYYNAHPVASVLLLNGSFSDTDRAAHAVKNASIGRLLRDTAARLGELQALPASPDVATLAVEIGFACLKFGYVQDGRINNAVRNEALRAVMAYLDRWRDDVKSTGN
ncbi:TetR/AcrR family transcriptional regulator [Sodalis sp. RH20]|uniref:TetR/AcrR family transcriptional regulator n=1 Tax=unclassified Sodalis (in: enterobacteria) TaxID=2636512 RepID=UPI0039B50FE9